MKSASYLVDVEQEPLVGYHHGPGYWSPKGLEAARACPGFYQAHAHMDVGDDVTILIIQADDLGPADAEPRMIRIAAPQELFSVYMKSLDEILFKNSPQRKHLLNHAEAMKMNPDIFYKLTVGDAIRKILKHREPAAHDTMYEHVIPFVKQTITDNFNRASLGPDWENIESTWAINASTTARPQTANVASAMRRTESSFPNDQFSQCDIMIQSGAQPSKGGTMVRCDAGGTYYYGFIAGTTETDLWRRVTASSSVFITCGAGGATVDVLIAMKVTVTGTTITVDLGGSQKINTTNSVIASGKPGVIQVTGDVPADSDNFSCTDAIGGSTAERSLPANFRLGNEVARPVAQGVYF